MSTALKWQKARQFYDTGLARFHEGNYEQALAELKRAEDLYRRLEARGHPFRHVMENGASCLANTLAASGRCHQELGNHRKAVTYYETSLINFDFEKKRPFRNFLNALNENLIACYEKGLAAMDPLSVSGMLDRTPDVDTSHRFPYSLGGNEVHIARLYELSPERYPQFREFYSRARKKDLGIRRMDKTSDESTMKKMSAYVWGILLLLWAVYGMAVARALLK